MRSSRWTDRALFVCAVFVTRYLCRSHFLYDIDSVNYALALDHFNPQAHQPHPPGYYLYVCLGRLIYGFTHDANGALVGLSIAAECGAVVAIYLLAEDWFGRKAALFAGALFVVSPLAWFHGTVALVYAIEVFFSAWVGYICWRIYRGETALVLQSGILLGVAVGFRPSSILLLGPLWLISVWKSGPRRTGAGVAALGLASLAWFVPMLFESGGAAAYFGSIASLWQQVPGRQSVLQNGIIFTLARLCVVTVMYGSCFGAGLIALLVGACPAASDKPKRLFTMVWVFPGLLFFSLVFFAYVNSGYLLALSPPVFAWLGVRAAAWHSAPRFGKRTKTLIIGLFAGGNVAFFLAAPVYFSYRAVRGFEASLVAIRTDLPRLFSAEDTLIVGFDSHFLGYRHAGYYLPDFFTMQYPEVSLEGGPQVFAVEHRNTIVLRELSLGRFKKFVFFPLPEGAAYRSYVDKVRLRFPKPPEAVRSGGREYITGGAADLAVLFPTVVRPNSP